MRFVPAYCIREGMIVGKPLMGKNGELLLNKGTAVVASYIVKIKELGYSGIYVDDDLSKDIEITEVITERLRFKTVKTIKDTFMNVQSGKDISFENIRDIGNLITNIVENIIGNKDIMINMVDLKVFDDYTFYHSVNVTVLSIVIGITMGLSKDQLYKLGLAAMLHDIGKVFIPKEILNKPGRLTDKEFEIMKRHSYKGYEYLKSMSQIPAEVYVSILQHHEKFDGTGYPLGLKGERICIFGRIISIADIYDALTSDRPYRKAMLPSEAIEYLMGNGGTALDPELVLCFTKRIAPYPIGTCVRLSNGKIGLVVQNYRDSCMRPKLKIIKHGDEDVEPYYMDLRNDMNTIYITIVGVLDELRSMAPA